MAAKKEPAKPVVKEAAKEKKYKVRVTFTERGKTRGYFAGDDFPRADDHVGPDTMKRLLGGNPNGIKYIQEV